MEDITQNLYEKKILFEIKSITSAVKITNFNLSIPTPLSTMSIKNKEKKSLTWQLQHQKFKVQTL